MKFEENDISQRNAEPYALKEFKGRWYLLAKDRKDYQIKTFGLDRIQELEITNKNFNCHRILTQTNCSKTTLE